MNSLSSNFLFKLAPGATFDFIKSNPNMKDVKLGIADLVKDTMELILRTQEGPSTPKEMKKVNKLLKQAITTATIKSIQAASKTQEMSFAILARKDEFKKSLRKQPKYGREILQTLENGANKSERKLTKGCLELKNRYPDIQEAVKNLKAEESKPVRDDVKIAELRKAIESFDKKATKLERLLGAVDKSYFTWMIRTKSYNVKEQIAVFTFNSKVIRADGLTQLYDKIKTSDEKLEGLADERSLKKNSTEWRNFTESSKELKNSWTEFEKDVAAFVNSNNFPYFREQHGDLIQKVDALTKKWDIKVESAIK